MVKKRFFPFIITSNNFAPISSKLVIKRYSFVNKIKIAFLNNNIYLVKIFTSVDNSRYCAKSSCKYQLVSFSPIDNDAMENVAIETGDADISLVVNFQFFMNLQIINGIIYVIYEI